MGFIIKENGKWLVNKKPINICTVAEQKMFDEFIANIKEEGHYANS